MANSSCGQVAQKATLFAIWSQFSETGPLEKLLESHRISSVLNQNGNPTDTAPAALHANGFLKRMAM
jgi:hypothetical protein